MIARFLDRGMSLLSLASVLCTVGGTTALSAQGRPGDLPASIPSFGEIVEIELSADTGVVHQGNFTGGNRPPARMIEFPLAADEAVVMVLESDTKIYAYQLEYKPGTTALEPVPDWKIYGQANCDDWRLKPGRHRCELEIPRLFGTKFGDENNIHRLLFVIADKSPRATIKLGLFRGVASDGLKFLRNYDALLPDGRQVTPRELLAQLDKPGRVLVPGDPADSRRGFLPRGEKAFSYVSEPTQSALAYSASKPVALRPFFAALHDGGENSAVLNFAKLGLAAIEAREWAIAEMAFDEALERIEAIFADDPAAAGARSNWENETFKDFKGEAYERAMAYYYRGLLYLREGDFENASASFRAGEYQDTMSSDAENRSDFGILPLLAGWAERCDGDEGAAADQFAVAGATGLTTPSAGEMTLVLAESGGAPIKQRFGIRQQFLTYSVPFSTDDKMVPVAQASGISVPLARSTSIFLQAATRGMRGMDSILAAKVAHGKSIDRTVDLAGFIPLVGPLILGATMGHVNRKIGELGTRADVRAWDSLPNRIHAGFLADRGVDNTQIIFAGTPAATGFTVDHARCSVTWSRQSSAIAEGAGLSGGDPEIEAARAAVPELVLRDRAFREELTNRSEGL